jgi:Cytochrome P450
MTTCSRRIWSSHPSRTSSIRRPGPLSPSTTYLSLRLTSSCSVHTVEGALAQPLVICCGRGKEFPSLRLHVLFKVGLKRLALRPFTFSNGVTITAGTLLSLPFHFVHADEEIYPDAQEFDPVPVIVLYPYLVTVFESLDQPSQSPFPFGRSISTI